MDTRLDFDDLPAHPVGLERFAAALGTLAGVQDAEETLQLAVDLSTELISGCDVADVMVLHDGNVTTAVFTDPLAPALDQAQNEAGQGPCLTAAHEQRRMLSDDVVNDERWSDFAVRAADLGLGSTVSYPLFVHDTSDTKLGALNLYSAKPDAFDDHAVELGEVLAERCSAVLAATIHEEGPRPALEHREATGKAGRPNVRTSEDHLAGSQQQRVRVARAVLSDATPNGSWRCGFCGCDYPIHDGWLVDYYYAPTRQAARSYVCAPCAARVQARNLHPALARWAGQRQATALTSPPDVGRDGDATSVSGEQPLTYDAPAAEQPQTDRPDGGWSAP